MSNEKFVEIANALANNDELRKTVIAMEPEEASKTLNAEGYDFTADELIAFGERVVEATANGELNEEELDTVAGGEPITLGGLLLGIAITVCYDIGKKIGEKW